MIVRTFTLKDQTTISGIRAHPDECRRGGGYVATDPFILRQQHGSPVAAPYAPGELAAMVVRPRSLARVKGQSVVPLDYNVTEEERAAVAEGVMRVERGDP